MCIFICRYFLHTHTNVYLYRVTHFTATSKWSVFHPFDSFYLPHHFLVLVCLTTYPNYILSSMYYPLGISGLKLSPCLQACFLPFQIFTDYLCQVCDLFPSPELLTPRRKGFCLLCLSNLGLVKTIHLNREIWGVVNVYWVCLCVKMIRTDGYVSPFFSLFFFNFYILIFKFIF